MKVYWKINICIFSHATQQAFITVTSSLALQFCNIYHKFGCTKIRFILSAYLLYILLSHFPFDVVTWFSVWELNKIHLSFQNLNSLLTVLTPFAVFTLLRPRSSCSITYSTSHTPKALWVLSVGNWSF